MMKRIIIIVEGHSEKEFIDKVLAPYLFANGIPQVICFKIKHSKGGLTKYEHLKKDLISTINESNELITTLIDFYALPFDFPQYDKAIKLVDKSKAAKMIEDAIVDDITELFNGVSHKLFPYIQLHEFEAFVFASGEFLFNFYADNEANFAELNKVINNFPNPEDINQGKTTAPSKRLLQAIPGYSKVNHGIAIIQDAGIENLLKKCPRFNAWVALLIEKAKSN